MIFSAQEQIIIHVFQLIFKRPILIEICTFSNGAVCCTSGSTRTKKGVNWTQKGGVEQDGLQIWFQFSHSACVCANGGPDEAAGRAWAGSGLEG